MYASKLLNLAKKNTNIKREALAMVYTSKFYQSIIYASKLLNLTKQSIPLFWLQNMIKSIVELVEDISLQTLL
jgi:hypothetical protein